jgi:hypothetical protein
MAVPFHVEELREPDKIKKDLVEVSQRLKDRRTALSNHGEQMQPEAMTDLIEGIQADVKKQDDLLGELEDSLTWQNPERLNRKP